MADECYWTCDCGEYVPQHSEERHDRFYHDSNNNYRCAAGHPVQRYCADCDEVFPYSQGRAVYDLHIAQHPRPAPPPSPPVGEEKANDEEAVSPLHPVEASDEDTDLGGLVAEMKEMQLGRTPIDGDEPRRQVELWVRQFEKQKRFREAVLARDKGRCLLTGCSLTAALEAAHIQPFRADGSFDVDNGLTLRADLHRLFDSHHWSIDGAGQVHMSLAMNQVSEALGAPLPVGRVKVTSAAKKLIATHIAAFRSEHPAGERREEAPE